MRTTFLIVLFLLLGTLGYSQERDSPSPFFPKSYGDKVWRPMFAYDNKHTTLSGVNLMTPGVRVGVEHKGVTRYNIGFARLAITEKLIIPRWDIPDCSLLYGKINHRGYFGMLYFERAIFRVPKLEISIPSYLQYGKLKAFSDTDMVMEPLYDEPFLGLATSVQLEYYIFPWLSPKVSAGYRHVFFDESGIPDRKMFNGFFWGVALRTNWPLLVKTIKERKQVRSDSEK